MPGRVRSGARRNSRAALSSAVRPPGPGACAVVPGIWKKESVILVGEKLSVLFRCVHNYDMITILHLWIPLCSSFGCRDELVVRACKNCPLYFFSTTRRRVLSRCGCGACPRAGPAGGRFGAKKNPPRTVSSGFSRRTPTAGPAPSHNPRHRNAKRKTILSTWSSYTANIRIKKMHDFFVNKW